MRWVVVVLALRRVRCGRHESIVPPPLNWMKWRHDIIDHPSFGDWTVFMALIIYDMPHWHHKPSISPPHSIRVHPTWPGLWRHAIHERQEFIGYSHHSSESQRNQNGVVSMKPLEKIHTWLEKWPMPWFREYKILMWLLVVVVMLVVTTRIYPVGPPPVPNISLDIVCHGPDMIGRPVGYQHDIYINTLSHHGNGPWWWILTMVLVLVGPKPSWKVTPKQMVFPWPGITINSLICYDIRSTLPEYSWRIMKNCVTYIIGITSLRPIKMLLLMHCKRVVSMSVWSRGMPMALRPALSPVFNREGSHPNGSNNRRHEYCN